MMEIFIVYAKYAGLLIGAIFLIIYLAKYRKEATLSKGISTILYGNGIAAGIAVVLLSFNSELCKFDQIEQIYVILGGVAVCWISYSSFDKTLQNNRE